MNPRFMISCALMLLVFPLSWIFSWLVAVVVHELFHYCALRICGCEVYSLMVTPAGVVMETSHLTGMKGIVCYLAGPLGGFLLCVFAKYFPLLAICGFLQSIFNLIPVRPLDGGQALETALKCVMSVNNVEIILSFAGKLVFFTGILVALVAVFVLKTCLPLLLFGFFLIRYNRNTACNEGLKRLQ